MYVIKLCFSWRACCLLVCGVCRELLPILIFSGFSICFPYFTKVVQLLCSLSGWLYLNCYSIGTGFNGAETNVYIGFAFSLCILLMKSNCFAIYFPSSISVILFRYLLVSVKIVLLRTP